MDTGDAFQRTVEPAWNPEPLTLRVKACPPATAELGFKLVIAGGATGPASWESVTGTIPTENLADLAAPGFALSTRVNDPGPTPAETPETVAHDGNAVSDQAQPGCVTTGTTTLAPLAEML